MSDNSARPHGPPWRGGGGLSPKLRLSSQVLTRTLSLSLSLSQLITDLLFPSDFLCHTSEPSKHLFTPHDMHHLTAAGLGGGLDPTLPAPSQSSKGLGRAGRRPPLHRSPFAPESWRRRLRVTFPLGFLGRDVFSWRWEGLGGDCFPGVYKICLPATLKGSIDHRAGPPARLLSPTPRITRCPAPGSDFSGQCPPGRGQQPSWRTK